MGYNIKSKTQISIIVPTYKRPELLSSCLISLMKQSVKSDGYEVIVADDDPRKSAQSVTEKVIARFPKRIINYLFVGKEQNAHARNEAAKKVKGEWLVFIDDDALAMSDWIRQIKKSIYQKSWLVFGGPILPYYQTKKPKWFKDKYEIRSHGTKIKILEPNLYLSASNLVVRKDAFTIIGGFDANLGVCGQHHGFGEEVKLQRKIRMKFGSDTIGYDPKIKVKHLVVTNKMRIIYIIRSRFTAGMYHEKTYEDRIGLIKAGFKAVRAVAIMAMKMARWAVKPSKKYRCWQNFAVNEVIPHCYEIGWFWEKVTWFNQR
ncbi:MAG: Glycosyltransferase, group 2 family protein [Candidatus Woesebacteria bacterium GW2011_GWA1_39_12]|uniref:Glycosyltransferase, group 2 family protein n=1 Tax=Candidatus Woesebacteria bacterium GW2011_GWA1_39_12 TaxID=1618549 RepID=A0A0G0Q5F5_9BACT|nr:MAG: Glycosyltransferase, group 2 family protein [Candidatus Woesebacteria bacterium GW2011_GWA1_39_12]